MQSIDSFIVKPYNERRYDNIKKLKDIDFIKLFARYINNKWKSHGKYCFVKPIPVEDSVLLKNTKHEPLQGILKYSNLQLDKLGVKEGDKIIFKPESEYEFNIDGELLYRMFTNNITTILDGK